MRHSAGGRQQAGTSPGDSPAEAPPAGSRRSSARLWRGRAALASRRGLKAEPRAAAPLPPRERCWGRPPRLFLPARESRALPRGGGARPLPRQVPGCCRQAAVRRWLRISLLWRKLLYTSLPQLFDKQSWHWERR
ncbi:peptidyl-prolyl cis-trans isomerase-like 3 isoform X2 [Falco naumanni]|uniref:peptidyl-prolyl cis-trans isomerase-like 3 isoform X2 n=1 Tax=Falco naumanni TaxID=148594 RepID=UPI001ADE780F|nr:peptidyl-prolyl cis-trans isomerase-like 3 isoform X2 [Falco naumanni]